MNLADAKNADFNKGGNNVIPPFDHFDKQKIFAQFIEEEDEVSDLEYDIEDD